MIGRKKAAEPKPVDPRCQAHFLGGYFLGGHRWLLEETADPGARRVCSTCGAKEQLKPIMKMALEWVPQ